MDDREERQPARASAAPSDTPLLVIGPQLVQWELSLERLKILQYETKYINNSKTRRLLHRLSFIMPAGNASHQFDDFINISSWLFSEITGDVEFFKKDQYDDPNAVVTKMLLALRKLDFKGTFQPAKLKQAYGEAVCTVLEFLTESAMASKKVEWAHPQYPDAEKAEALDDDEHGDDVADEVDAGGDEDALFEEGRELDAGEVSVDDAAHQMLEAHVDPVQWKAELERVGPKLRSGQQLSSNEWRAHVDQTVTSRGLIDKILVDAKGDLSSMSKYDDHEMGYLS
jgi:estrogen-related receptor beta like 1